jgi:hypothetical protein
MIICLNLILVTSYNPGQESYMKICTLVFPFAYPSRNCTRPDIQFQIKERKNQPPPPNTFIHPENGDCNVCQNIATPTIDNITKYKIAKLCIIFPVLCQLPPWLKAFRYEPFMNYSCYTDKTAQPLSLDMVPDISTYSVCWDSLYVTISLCYVPYILCFALLFILILLAVLDIWEQQ